MRITSFMRGLPQPTVKVTVSDSVQTLSDVGVTLSSGKKTAVGALITVDKPGGSGYDLRCSFGDTGEVTPTTTLGHIMYAGDSIFLDNPLYLSTFQFTNRSAGNNAVFHITVEFD